MKLLMLSVVASAGLVRLCAGEPAGAGSSVAFVSENDLYGGHGDRYYTSGLRLAYVSEPVGVAGGGEGRWFAGLVQELYTAENRDVVVPPANDHPYSSWLYGTAGYAWLGTSSADVFTVNAGVVGPSARGEQIQSEWHRFIGAPVCRGWASQLRDEPGIDLAYLRAWRYRVAGDGDGLAAECLPRVGVEVGTVRNVAKAAVQLRFGRRLPEDFGEWRMRDGVSGVAARRVDRPVSRPWTPDIWYVYADVQAEAWARNMMLDGNLWHDSASVDADRAVAQFSCGVVGHWGAARVAFSQVVRTREFRGQDGVFIFGGLSVTVTH